MLSRKPGCGAYTKCLDTHPKRGRLGSSNSPAPHTRERALRRRGPVDSSVAARYRRAKQCTDGQATNHAGGDFTTACNRRPGCNHKTKTACNEQTDQKLSHFGPLRM